MILDTCAVLWLATGDRRLSRGARDRIADAVTVYFCAITAYELALKVRDGKLALPLPVALWLQQVARRHRLSELALDSDLCAAAVGLPPHHRDPADRMIIAAAQRLHVPVVTVDPAFAAYGVGILR